MKTPKQLKNEIDSQPAEGQIDEAKLNELRVIETLRPNGRRRIQLDFQYCPTMTEQHSAHMTDLNYLISRYKPDELAAYIAAKNSYKQEIMGHDFSQEPSLQEAKNITYQLKQNFERLPDEIKTQFRSHVEFLKFIDNPANQEKMIKLGLMTPKQIDSVSTNSITNANDPTNANVNSNKTESPKS